MNQPIIDKMIKGRVLAQVFREIFLIIVMCMISPGLQEAPRRYNPFPWVSGNGEFPRVAINGVGQSYLVLPDRLMLEDPFSKQTLLYGMTGAFGNVDENTPHICNMLLRLIRNPGRPVQKLYRELQTPEG